MARNKPNPMLAKIEARHQAELRAARLFAVQQSKDMMLIAAREVFGIGPDRAKKLSDAFDAVWKEYDALCVDDAKDDKEIWYTKEKIDRILRDICGEHFVPWDERYT